MQFTGRTRSVVDGFDIISGRELADAVARLSAASKLKAVSSN
jgi:hypothetical protein